MSSLVLHVATALLFVRFAASSPGASLEVFAADPFPEVQVASEVQASRPAPEPPPPARRATRASRPASPGLPPRPAAPRVSPAPSRPAAAASSAKATVVAAARAADVAATSVETTPGTSQTSASATDAKVSETTAASEGPGEVALTEARALVGVSSLVDPAPAPAPVSTAAIAAIIDPPQPSPAPTPASSSQPASHEDEASVERSSDLLDSPVTRPESVMPTPEPETPQPARPAARPVFTDLPALPALGQSAPARPDRESRWRERPAVIADLPALPPLDRGAPGSPFGLGLAKLRVQLEGPRSRLTDRPAETVSGRIVGGAAERVVVYVNGTPRDVTLDGRTFHAPVGLQVGVNEVRVVARDLQGAETEDTMLLEYVPPAPPRIALLSPKDGHTLSPEDPPVVLVEGQVEDATVSSVVLLVDEERLTIPTSGGRFRHIVPIAAPVVRLGAELVLPGGRPQHAPVVTVRSGIPAGSVGLLVVQWAPDAAGTDVEVAASWRARSDRLGEDVAVALNGVTARGASARVYYMRNLRPGVYTFTLRRGAPGAPGVVRPTLYLPSAGTLVPRPLEAVTLDGHGAAYLARVLWPHGVLWEQDDWFTGKTQSADTVTKFRLPEGISWTERKAVLR